MQEASTDQDRAVLNERVLLLVTCFKRGKGSGVEKEMVAWQESAMNWGCVLGNQGSSPFCSSL